MRKIFLLSIIVIAGFFFQVSAQYSGRVFLDDNMNQSYDSGEKLLQGIKVTDGKTVVVTNNKGEYELPGYKSTRFIYITVPAGYQASGSFYLRVEKGKSSYDIGLKKFERTANSARFVQLADTEDRGYGKWISYVKDYAAKNDIGFIVHTGDICYEEGLKFHAKEVMTETMGVPVYYCIGNHDLVKGDYGEQLYESLFGPVYYSFDAGNTHFIVTPMRSGDYKPSYTPNQVYNWLVNDLKNTDPSMNLVVFNHDLLTFGDEFVFKAKGGKELNFNEHNLKAWIYGHWHINFLKKHGDTGIISVCSSTPDKGGIDHSPSNFMVYDVTRNGEVTVTPRCSYIDKHITISSLVGSDLLLNEKGNLIVLVNIYHTVSPTKSVKGVLSSESGGNVPFTLTQNSDWNWSGEVPVGNSMKTEKLKLTVEALFDDGEVVKKDMPVGLFATDLGNDNLRLMWTENAGGNIWMAPPLEAKGKVFVATIDDFGMKQCGITAYSAEDGLKLWHFKTEGSVKNTICYFDGKVLATDHFGIAYAIDENSGELVWKKELGQTSLGAFNTGSVVDNGIYYTGFGNYLQAIDAKSGETIWVNEAWRGGEGATHTMIVADDVLIAASNWRALYAHDIKTGKLLWKKSDDGYSSRSSSATWFNDTLYVASKDGIGLMDVHTGEMYKYFKTDYSLQVSTKPLIIDDLLIMGTRDNGVVAFNRFSGTEVWKVVPGEALVYSSPYSRPESHTVETLPVNIKGSVVFGASDGFLYWVNPKDGSVVQKEELGAPILAPVTPYLNGFFVADFGGNVYRFVMMGYE